MKQRSVIRGAARIPQRDDNEYWALVQQLMTAGWYRLGPGCDSVKQEWGFRRGHTLTRERDGMYGGSAREARWFKATDELSAMRTLLQSLTGSARDSGGDSGTSRTSAGPATASIDDAPGGLVRPAEER